MTYDERIKCLIELYEENGQTLTDRQAAKILGRVMLNHTAEEIDRAMDAVARFGADNLIGV